jgi:hypothetical protein
LPSTVLNNFPPEGGRLRGQWATAYREVDTSFNYKLFQW